MIPPIIDTNQNLSYYANMKKLPYKKPKVSAKKIKVNFFLIPHGFLDDLHLVGDVYAQSGNPNCQGCS